MSASKSTREKKMAQVKKARSSNLLGRSRRLRCCASKVRASRAAAANRRGSGDGAEGALGAG
jgi:hypothetical protein